VGADKFKHGQPIRIENEKPKRQSIKMTAAAGKYEKKANPCSPFNSGNSQKLRLGQKNSTIIRKKLANAGICSKCRSKPPKKPGSAMPR
jgi:hypothetical protein